MFRKALVVSIIILLFGASIISATGLNLKNKDKCPKLIQSNIEPFFPYGIIPNLDFTMRIGQYVQQTADKGYIVTGFESETVTDNSTPDIKTLLIKYDENGNREWRETFELTGDNMGYSVQQTDDQGYIIGGSIITSNESHAMLLKVNELGKKEWMKTYEGVGFSQGTEVQQTKDKGYILTGASTPLNTTNISSVLLVKTDANGIEEWNTTFVFGYDSIGNSVQQTEDLGYIICGSIITSENLNSSVVLIKADNNGTKEWNNSFEFYDVNVGYSVQQTEDLGFIIGGYTVISDNLTNYALLLKTYENGTKEWHKTFSNKFGFSAQQTNDKGYIICGAEITKSKFYSMLLKTDEKGNETWVKNYAGLGVAQGVMVRQTFDKGYILTGFTLRSIFSTETFVLVLKTNEEGNLEWSSSRAKNYSTARTIDSFIIWLLEQFPLLKQLLNLI